MPTPRQNCASPQHPLLVVFKHPPSRWSAARSGTTPARPTLQATATRATHLLPSMPPISVSRLARRRRKLSDTADPARPDPSTAHDRKSHLRVRTRHPLLQVPLAESLLHSHYDTLTLVPAAPAPFSGIPTSNCPIQGRKKERSNTSFVHAEYSGQRRHWKSLNEAIRSLSYKAVTNRPLKQNLL